MGNVTFDVSVKYSKGTSKYLWKLREFTKMFDEPEMRTRINYFILDAIQPYVPKKSGELRRSRRVYPDKITWGEGVPYAHYQFAGEVWGPNYPGIEGDGSPGWRSPRGTGSKYPTGRELGAFNGILMLSPKWQVAEGGYVRPKSFERLPYKFGYTTANTRHHWTDVYTGKLKLDTNNKITKYLKKECQMRGLNV